MITAGISRVIILVFGILYPAYNSYKAIRTKNVKEYVRWMMHWIVFAVFQLVEIVTDIFLCWFPFYYEAKVCIVIWLLSPMTRGSSILYKKFIHPKLARHEQEIDEYINQAKTKSYSTVIELGTKTFDYASKIIVETAIKATGNVMVNPLQNTAFTQSNSNNNKNSNRNNSKRNRDVVDYAIDEDTTVFIRDNNDRNTPMQIDDTNEFQNQQHEIESLMHENNSIEFSDIDEPQIVQQPQQQRSTRSQSRAKENSLQPTTSSETESKSSRRGIGRKKAVAKKRGRPVVKKEAITDDELELYE